MQPSMDHFTELRQLLQTGHYENDARQPAIPRSTRSRPVEPDALVFSAQQQSAARPPLARTGVAAATRSRRPPPPPAVPPFLPQGSVRVPSTRAAATRNDVDLYLAQLNQHQPQQQPHQSTRQNLNNPPAAPAPAEVEQPAPEQHRRAKRGKPMARRSLQALFDAAAEDSSTWQTSASTGGDVEDDGDTGVFASATSGDSSSLLLNNSNGNKPSTLVSSLSDAALAAGMPGPSTPANCDSGLLAAAAAGAGAAGSESPAAAGGKNIQDDLSSIVPLRHLLMSERGRKLSALEAKAIIFRVAEDLAALHAANAVHRRVSIESISLTTCYTTSGTTTTTNNNNNDNDPANIEERNGNNGSSFALSPVAVAILPPGRSAAVLGSNRCYWALKDSAFDAQHAPPEVACCPVDRPVAFTPAGDMWGLGVVLFSLLSAGRVPFEGPSCLCSNGGGGNDDNQDSSGNSAMTSTVDASQRHLHRHLHCQIDVINELSAAQTAASETGSQSEEDLMEMTAIGFDAEAKKLLLGLLHADPAQRLCATDVLKHPWVAEAIPFVPKMPTYSLPFGVKSAAIGGGGGGGGTDGARESTPPMSDVLRRTEQLGFATSNQTTADAPTATAAAFAALTAPAAAAAAAECPYPVIGHVAQPVEVIVAGRKVTISALHAVYDVPGYGAMMSAAPLAVADPAEVSAAAAAAAANGYMPTTVSTAAPLSHFLNVNAPPPS